MDIYKMYGTLNECLLGVIQKTSRLTEVQEEEKVEHVRLEESSCKLTEDTIRFSKVVSAHDITQYRNVFHSIKLQKSTRKTWLEELIEVVGDGGCGCCIEG